MSNKLFTQKEIQILSKNPYVKNVTERGITYTKEFKELFVKEYKTGIYSPVMIFEKYGLSKEILGYKRIECCSSRWRKQAKRIDGFEDNRSKSSGRPKIHPLTKDEEITKLKETNKRLKQELEFLKKIQLLDRMELEIQRQRDLSSLKKS